MEVGTTYVKDFEIYLINEEQQTMSFEKSIHKVSFAFHMLTLASGTTWI